MQSRPNTLKIQGIPNQLQKFYWITNTYYSKLTNEKVKALFTFLKGKHTIANFKRM